MVTEITMTQYYTPSKSEYLVIFKEIKSDNTSKAGTNSRAPAVPASAFRVAGATQVNYDTGWECPAF